MIVRDAFRDQAASCAALGSPFMARLMALCAERLQPGTPVADRVFGWTGDPSTNADNVPLRLAGALHALKLQEKSLVDVYPPNDVGKEALWEAIQGAMTDHTSSVLSWLDNTPQTNEVRRAAAILPTLAILKDRFERPVELLELGTSGGLNLRADKFRLNLPGGFIGSRDASVVLTPEWRGSMPPKVLPDIARRAGVDLSPIDPSLPEGELRLLAYLWADQPDRIARTRAAIAVARNVSVEISAGDAGVWLEQELSTPNPDHLLVVLHTIAWQYFPPETRVRAEAAMNAASGPLARIAMEYDGGKGASVSLTTWPGGQSQEIARADFHGRWVTWAP